MRIAQVCRRLAVAASALAWPLAAQTGSIGGRVTVAEEGSPIAFVTVIAIAANGGVAASATTDAVGRYRIMDLAAGTYSLYVRHAAFFPSEVSGVVVTPGGTANVDVQLSRVTMLERVAVVGVPGGSGAGEKILTSASSISVVSEEQIAERPAVTVADHLKSVPGLSIQTGGKAQANIVSRGFNNVFSTSMLMLQDYRFAGVPSLRVNVPFLFTGTNEDIERIEVLNGPASALYGPNSANGVLHVITKSPLLYQGTTLTLDGGTQELLRVSGRHSAKLGSRLGVKLSGEYMRAVDFEYHDPNEPGVYPSVAPEGRRGMPLERDFNLERMSGEFRADYRFGDNTELVSTYGFSRMGSALELTTVFGTVQAKDWTYFSGQERFRHKKFFAQVFFNGSNSGNESGTDLSGSHYLRTGIPVVDKSTVLVGQVQQGFTLGGYEMMAGLDAIRTTPVTEGTINGRNEDDDDVTETGVYLQGTFPLSAQLDFIGALRGDRNNRLEGTQFSPRAALVFKPSETHNFRLTYNRAFNSPANFTFFLDQIQNPQIAPGFALQAIGNPARQGWQFDRTCDASVNNGLCMRSPYAPGQTLNSSATNAYPGFIQSLDEIVTVLPNLTDEQRAGLLGILNHPQLGPLLRSLNPSASDVGTVLRLGSAAVFADDVKDIPALEASFNNTYEIGYKGIVGNRASIAVDFWFQERGDVGLPAGQANPGVFYDPISLGQYIATQVAQALAPQVGAEAAQQQGAQVAAALVPLMAQLPVGSITLDSDLVTDHSFIATYATQPGQIEVAGVDLAVEYSLTDRITVAGTYSYQDKIVFPEVGTSTNPLMSNSPKHRATNTWRYRNDGWRFNAEARVRYTDKFPINSGVFNSLGSPPNAAGVALYEAPGAAVKFDLGFSKGLTLAGREVRWSLFGENLADDDTPTFVGVPAIGRSVSTRLQFIF